MLGTVANVPKIIMVNIVKKVSSTTFSFHCSRMISNSNDKRAKVIVNEETLTYSFCLFKLIQILQGEQNSTEHNLGLYRALRPAQLT